MRDMTHRESVERRCQDVVDGRVPVVQWSKGISGDLLLLDVVDFDAREICEVIRVRQKRQHTGHPF